MSPGLAAADAGAPAMIRTSPSARLLAKLDLAYPVVAEHAERIWSSPHVQSYYPVYLKALHAIVRSAVPLVTAALDRARLLAPEDPIAARLIDYFVHNAREEAGHDDWLLEDLAATGVDPREALDQFPSARIASLVGAQYYWISHYHPFVLLGHIAALESYHPPAGFADRLQRLTGYPKAAFRTLEAHQGFDIEHKRDLYALIDGLDLDRAQETILALSALHCFHGAIEVLEEVFSSDFPTHSSEKPPAPVEATAAMLG